MGSCRVISAPARSLGHVGQLAEPGPLQPHGLVALGLSAPQRVAWLAGCPGRGRRACADASQRGPPSGVTRHRVRRAVSAVSPGCAQGGQRRLPGMCSVSWGCVRLPAFPPGLLASASRCVPGLQIAGPTHPSPSPSQGPGACQVVRLPVTHSGSPSCPPGKAAEQLGGQGEVFPGSASAAPRLSTLDSGLALRQGPSGALPGCGWGLGAPTAQLAPRDLAPELRRMLAFSGWFGPGSKNECNTLVSLRLLLINKTWVEKRTR